MSEVHEEWIVVVNRNTYHLNEKQAKLLNDAIANGNRGIVQFKDFVISVPYIQELYLNRRWRDEKYQIEAPEEVEVSEEQRLKNLKRLEEMKKKLKRKGIL